MPPEWRDHAEREDYWRQAGERKIRAEMERRLDEYFRRRGILNTRKINGVVQTCVCGRPTCIVCGAPRLYPNDGLRQPLDTRPHIVTNGKRRVLCACGHPDCKFCTPKAVSG